MNVKEIRKQNMRMLAELIGGITPMANLLGKSQSQISHLIGKKPIKNIGDRIAAQIEVVFNKPHGWMDHIHQSPDDEIIYKNKRDEKFVPCFVPLLSWSQVGNWPNEKTKQVAEGGAQHIPVIAKLSKYAFAVRVQGDSMESPSGGVSFPDGCIIIADPDYVASNRTFVVARVGNEKEATFKQLITDGNKRYLKPLNPRYPIIEVSGAVTYCGVVRQMFMEFG